MPALLRNLSASGVDFLAKSRRRLPGRSKSMGAERRKSEFNIIGSAGVVSTEYTLESIKQAQVNKRLTKLELEDLINHDNDSSALNKAVEKLLAKDNERKWQYIRFVDTVHVSNAPGMSAEGQWREYSTKKAALWDQISHYASGKPIMFHVKIEVALGTTVSCLRSMMKVLHDLESLIRVDCGGALFGFAKSDVPEELQKLCSKPILLDDSDDSNDSFRDDEPELQEMVTFTLSMTAPDPDVEPVNKGALFFRKCNKYLKKVAVANRRDNDKNELEDRSSMMDHSSMLDHSSMKGSTRDVNDDASNSSLSLPDLNDDSSAHSKLSRSSSRDLGNSSRSGLSIRRIRRRRSRTSLTEQLQQVNIPLRRAGSGSRIPIRPLRPLQQPLRRTKSCSVRRPSKVTNISETDEKSTHSRDSSLGRRHSRRSKRSSSQSKSPCRSLEVRRTKSLVMERRGERPDYDWINKRPSDPELDIQADELEKWWVDDLSESGKDQKKPKPDFRWDKQQQTLEESSKRWDSRQDGKLDLAPSLKPRRGVSPKRPSAA